MRRPGFLSVARYDAHVSDRETWSGPVIHIRLSTPCRTEEKAVFITPDTAKTYTPVQITVAYCGQNPVPKPFVMVLLWIKMPKGWKMTTDIAIPVRPDPAAH